MSSTSQPVTFQLFVKSQAGARRRLPRRLLGVPTWKEIRYGGFADFTIETKAAFSDLASIIATDIVEVWINGVPRYRGEITSRRRGLGEPPTLTLAGYGRMLRVGNHVVQKRYIKYGGYDVSLQFRDLVADTVEPFEPNLSVRVLPVGQTIEQLDAYGQTTKDAINSIVTYAANMAVWGCNVVTDPADPDYLSDCLYMQPVSSSADWVIPASSRKTTSGETEEATDKVINVLYINGGSPKYPNLLYNGDFERPVFAGNGVSNLLGNPGFEIVSGSSVADWTLSSGASPKPAGGLEGPPFAGNWMVELDHVGETISQTDPVAVAAQDVTFAGHFRRELDDQAVSGTMSLEFLDGGGSTLATENYSGIAPPSVVWEYYYKTVRAPSGAAQIRLSATLDSIASVGTGSGGLLLDEMEVFLPAANGQDQWAMRPAGSAEVLSVNYLYPDAYHGGYGVFVSQTSEDVDGQDIQWHTVNNLRYDVIASQEIMFGVWLKLPPGVTSNGKMFLEIHGYKSDGTRTGDGVRFSIDAGQTWAGWKFFSTSYTMPTDAVKGEAWLTFRGDGAIIFDAFCARDIAAYTTDAEWFIPDGNLQAVIKAADLYAADTSAEGISIAGSAAKYGEHVDIVSETSLTTIADAQAYARAVFEANALPPVSPVFERVDDPRVFRCGQAVALSGPDGQVLDGGQALPIVMLTHTYDGSYKVKISTERERPDPGANILYEIQKRLNLGNLGGGSGGGSGSAGTVGGGISGNSSGGYWGTEPRTDTDSTLHDAYTPAGGVHVTGADRTAWAGAAGEVTAAHASSLHGAYADLLSRLEAIEAQAAAGFTGTVALAKLTSGGTAGSLTVGAGGKMTAYTAPT